jgi:DNA-binding MarR family transcriptional regulator
MKRFNFEINLIFAILNGQVSTAINRKLVNDFKKRNIELNPEQWTVLLKLWEGDGLTQQQLCNAIYKDRPSMTRLLTHLERKGLVVRIGNKKDRRTNLIYLTLAGKELETKAKDVAKQTLKQTLKGLTKEEMNVCQECLGKIIRNTKQQN